MSIARRTFFPLATPASATLTGTNVSQAKNGHPHNHGSSQANQQPSSPASEANSSANGPLTGSEHHAGHPSLQTGVDPEAYRRFVAKMHSGMDKMMRDMHADPPSGDPDVDFLVMMIPHHWGATEMARLVLLYGRDPLVREIAEKILATQITEIEGMRGRLAALRLGAESYPSLTGNRG